MSMFRRLLKAQVAAEFIFLVGILLFFMIFFIAAYSIRNLAVTEEGIKMDTNRIGDEVASQINTAYLTGPGYTKIYNLPNKTGGAEYQIYVFSQNGYVLIKVRGNSYFFPIITRNVTGNFTTGENKIKNCDNMIFINCSTCYWRC